MTAIPPASHAITPTRVALLAVRAGHAGWFLSGKPPQYGNGGWPGVSL